MVNGIVSLISLSELSLLVYRNASDFCVLIFYPATLPNSLMSSSCFLVAALGFSMYSIMSSTSSDSYTSSSQFEFLLFLFLLWLPWLGLPKLILNKSGESAHPCFVPDLRGNAFSFLPLRIMFAMGLLYMTFIKLRYVPSMPSFSRVFIINGC